MRRQHRLVVLARVRRALVRVLKEPGLWTAPLQGHVERPDRQVEIVDRADCPADREARVEVEDHGQVRFPVVPDTELTRVADPPLIRALGGEFLLQEIGGRGPGALLPASIGSRACG